MVLLLSLIFFNDKLRASRVSAVSLTAKSTMKILKRVLTCCYRKLGVIFLATTIGNGAPPVLSIMPRHDGGY